MPGRQHQAVVGELRAAREHDRGGPAASTAVAVAEGHGHAVAGELGVVELLLVQLAQAGDHLVAERAGGEGLALLDQRHARCAGRASERAGAGRAGEAAADDHHARAGACAMAGIGSSAAAAPAAVLRNRAGQCGDACQ